MADETTVEFDAPAFRSTLEKLLERVNTAILPGLHVDAERLRALANQDVPVESGDLKASAFVDSGFTARGNPAATVGYDAPNAGAIHEGFHFGKKRKVPHQFWLQRAANGFKLVATAERVRGAIG